MKNIKAFVIAFILFLLTITGMKLLSFHGLPQYSLAYGTWIDSSKFTSNDGLKKLLEDKESIPVFGSSELRQSQKTGFHADDIYKKGGLKPVFIGKGGHQSLFHSIVLGSLGDTLKNRKLVLSVSPQWFKTTGVRKDAFGDSYSESNFIAFLKNENISDPVKNYVIGRMKELSEENPAMYERIEEDVNWYYKKDGNIGDQVRAKVHSFLVSEKADTRLLLNMMWKDKFHEEKNVDSHRQIDWNSYYKKAEKCFSVFNNYRR